MKNFLVILSLVIFGWEASVPLVYFAVQGYLNVTFVLIAGIFGNMVSDSLWYFVGYKITHERLGQIKYFRNRPHYYHTISNAVRKRGLLFLFCSKFLYGMGTPSHILSGAYRLPFFKTFVVNVLGTVMWLAFIFSLARGAQEITSLKEDLVISQLVFASFIILMFGIHLVAGKFVKKFFHLDEKGEESTHDFPPKNKI